MKNPSEMEPKYLPKFPGFSRSPPLEGHRKPHDRPGTPQHPPRTPKGCPRDPHETQKEPQRLKKSRPKQPKMLQRTPRDTSRAQKTTTQRNQNSKREIEATTIAQATQPTQLSNNTASKMTSALRNARSACPPPPACGEAWA